MRKIYSDENFKNKFFDLVKRKDNYDNQLYAFFTWLFDNHFFDNIEDIYIQNCLDNDNICLPIMKNNGVAIKVDAWEKIGRIGIDPLSCFNKLSSCSIIVNLPIKSKREVKSMYNLLDVLLDKRSNRRKEWIKEAPTLWCGGYRVFE